MSDFTSHNYKFCEVFTSQNLVITVILTLRERTSTRFISPAKLKQKITECTFEKKMKSKLEFSGL